MKAFVICPTRKRKLIEKAEGRHEAVEIGSVNSSREAFIEVVKASSMFFQWFFYARVRQAIATCKHVRRLLHHQRDILSPEANDKIEGAIQAVRNAIADRADRAGLEQQVRALEEAANSELRPYPNAAWRENIEVLLVALTVAMAVRTFILQPMKIPTGSMQPTLYGVTSAPDYANIIMVEDMNKVRAEVEKQATIERDLTFPKGWQRVKDWFAGISYLRVVAAHDGKIEGISPPLRFLIFNLKQVVRIGGYNQTIWLPPDYGEQPLEKRAGLFLQPDRVYHKGETVIKMRVSAGDHLFVDRFTYNFRPPKRGEIIVFETKGIPKAARDPLRIPADQFYIKRLVGLGDETLKIHEDHRVTGVPQAGFGTVDVGNLVVNGRPITAATPHFENLYSFSGASSRTETLEYRNNRYYGHAMIQSLAPGREFHTQPDSFFVMGDNTMNSLDSRYWGDFPSQYVIGRAFFVYWPFTTRFGWGCLEN